MWNQLVNFNYDITYVGGWCLAAVQDGYNSLHWFATALKQWEAEPNKHYDRPPSGIDVPVYFSIDGNAAGHIAVLMKNGKVASSSYAGTHRPMALHNGIDGLIKDYAAGGVTLKYLGWGEHCANLKVIEEKNMSSVYDLNNARQIAYSFLGRDGRDGRKNAIKGETDADLKKWVGQPMGNADITSAWDSPEAKEYRKKLDAVYTERDNLRKKVKELEAGGQFVKVTDLYIKK